MALSRIAVVLMLSLAIAWGLSYLPDIQQRSLGTSSELSVFHEFKPVRLTEENVVDWVVGIPKRLVLSKVELRNHIVAMDFKLKQPSGKPSEIYAQMVDVTQQGFAGTTNVDRVQIRVYLPSTVEDSKQQLLIALDAERAQYREQDYELWRGNKLSAEQWLTERFHLTRTPRFEKLTEE